MVNLTYFKDDGKFCDEGTFQVPKSWQLFEV
jgi:hypothetical protein